MGFSDTRSMYGGTMAYASADNNGGADTELVAAVSGKSIVVDRLIISSDAAFATFFESGTTTAITPVFYTAAGSNMDLDDLNFRTVAGAALTYTSTGTGNVSIIVMYHLI